MAEKDPYYCCGGHRDTPFCPMCGKKMSPREGQPLYLNDFGRMRCILRGTDDAGDQVRAVNWVAAINLHTNDNDSLWLDFNCELGVWFDLDNRTGAIRLRVFKRREADNDWEPEDEWCVLEHQLWPFEPKPVERSLADSNGHRRTATK